MRRHDLHIRCRRSRLEGRADIQELDIDAVREQGFHPERHFGQGGFDVHARAVADEVEADDVGELVCFEEDSDAEGGLG